MKKKRKNLALMRDSFFPETEATQPPEWEELLKDVTIERDYHEIPYDPAYLAVMEQAENPLGDMGRREESGRQDTSMQIETVREIVRRKLRGHPQQCILRILDTGAGIPHIAKELRISEDTARRSVQKGIQIIKECLDLSTKKDFPVRKGKRPAIRAALFFLDTPAERQEFQEFLNQYPVLHISYRGESLFREALILYKTGKSARYVNKQALGNREGIAEE